MAASAYEHNGTLIVENAWLRVHVERASGRLTSIFDKRSNSESLLSDFGVRVNGKPVARAFAASLSMQEDGGAAIIVSGIESAEGISWSLQVGLADDSCLVSLVLTVFNRREAAKRFSIGLTSDPVDQPRLYAYSDPLSAIHLFREAHLRVFPYQTMRFRGVLVPRQVGEGAAFGNDQIVISRLADSLCIESSKPIEQARVVLMLSDGSPIEAVTNLSPQTPVRVAYEKLSSNPVALRVLDASGADIYVNHNIDEHPADGWVESGPRTENHRNDELSVGDVPHFLDDHGDRLPHMDPRHQDAMPKIALDPRFAPWAYLQLALARMNEQRWADAATFANESLVHNSANPIAWWVKHVCIWKMGEDDPDALVNAHYLAPHEPLLKADAFLRSHEGGEKLLDSWGDDPQPFREVAEFLILAGLFEDLYTWLTEAMRRSDDPMLGATLAWGYKQVGKEIEAEAMISRIRESGRSLDPVRLTERQIASNFGLWDPPL